MGCRQGVASELPGDAAEQVAELQAENQRLRKKVEELEQEVNTLKKANEELQNVQLTHRNIFYNEEKQKKRLPVFNDAVRGATEVGSLAFGECFAVRDQKDDGTALWLQIHGGDYSDGWVLGRDAGTVNCADMTKFGTEKYGSRIDSSEYRGQNFPKKLSTEGFAGSNDNSICLLSASVDSLWRELNIEMLLRGIATATIFEQEDWGGEEAFTDWVTYYAMNCVQYAQLRTPSQKKLLVTVKPTSRWRAYQADSCRGANLETIRDDIGNAQYKECSWLQGMKDQLHVKWEDVEFLTCFAFLRKYCAWTQDDCKMAANERLLWVLEEFFSGGFKEKATYELECAYWLWDEAFDGAGLEEVVRDNGYYELQYLSEYGAQVQVPPVLQTASASPTVWAELAAAWEAKRKEMAVAGRLSAGGAHSALLDAAGALRMWGCNKTGCSEPPSLANGESWAAVRAGNDYTLGLTTGGTLHAWGGNGDGQCSPPALPQGERWVAASAGKSHSLGLTDTGKLHAWGNNGQRRCEVPVLPAGESWASASAGAYHSLGLTRAGTLHAWGSDGCGQCSKAPALPQGQRWIAVNAGYFHSLGLTTAGELHAWGANGRGQCSGVPPLLPGERWVAISAGEEHSLGLTSAGALHAWGWDDHGQCRVPAGERWLALSAGEYHSLGLTTAGLVRAWGLDSKGQVSKSPHIESW